MMPALGLKKYIAPPLTLGVLCHSSRHVAPPSVVDQSAMGKHPLSWHVRGGGALPPPFPPLPSVAPPPLPEELPPFPVTGAGDGAGKYGDPPNHPCSSSARNIGAPYPAGSGLTFQLLPSELRRRCVGLLKTTTVAVNDTGDAASGEI